MKFQVRRGCRVNQQLCDDLIELLERYNNPPGTQNREFVKSLTEAQQWFLERRLTEIITSVATLCDIDNQRK
jgi:hypothetical protein